VLDQATTHAPIQAALLNIVEFVEHEAQVRSLERPDSFADSLLEVLIKDATASEARFREAVVKSGRVLRLHILKASLILDLEGLKHRIVEDSFFCVGHQYLAELNRLESVELLQNDISQIEQERVSARILRLVITVNDVGQFLGRELLSLLYNDSLEHSEEHHATILRFRVGQDRVGD